MTIDQPQPRASAHPERADLFSNDLLDHRGIKPVSDQRRHDGHSTNERRTGQEGPYKLSDGRVALPAMSVDAREHDLKSTVMNGKARAEDRLQAVEKLAAMGVKSLDLVDSSGHAGKARLEVSKLGGQNMVHLFVDSGGHEKVVLRGLTDSAHHVKQERDNQGKQAGFTGKGHEEFSSMRLAEAQPDKRQPLEQRADAGTNKTDATIHPNHRKSAETKVEPTPAPLPPRRDEAKVEPHPAPLPPRRDEAKVEPNPAPLPPRRDEAKVEPHPAPLPPRRDETKVDTRPKPLEGDKGRIERPDSMPGGDGKGRVFEFNHLENRAADHRGPDAIVRLPENFDPNKPVNVLVYNHGFRSSVKSSFAEAELEKQMRAAPPNTVLVMPEWQASPASESGNMGRFGQPGRFKGMLQEVFDKTPGLAGKKISDINEINIVAHSAGYKPTEAQIYNNGLDGKVKSITLLDALYDPHGFDRWLKSNIRDLADGTKQFNNIYSGTSDASRAQASRVRSMLSSAGLSDGAFYHETGNSRGTLDPAQMQTHSIVFKYSKATTGDKGPHMSLPNLYINRVLKAQGA